MGVLFIVAPNAEARAQILRVHLQGRNREPERYDLTTLAALAEGYSGAEIEEAIVAALYDAFQAGVELEDLHIARALRATVPLSITMSEKVEALRSWARGRTVSAD